MENSTGQFDQDFLERIQTELCRKIPNRISPSEPMSLCSHLSEESFLLGGLRKLNALESISLIVVLSTKRPWIYDLVRVELAEKAKKNKYQGKWLLVHQLCTLKFSQLILHFLLTEKKVSPRVLFGNIVPLGVKKAQAVQVVFPSTKVVYPQRKRGHNDKGTRREDSKWLPKEVWLGPNPEKRDLTNLVGNSKKATLNFLYG